jgi:uncharacterized DUF497 family protein
MGRKLTFEWDGHNLNHLARHGVSREEFEEAFGRPMVERIVTGSEDRITALGKTMRGRYLFLVYTMRSGHVRAVTAYTLPRKQRRVYDKATTEEYPG